MQTCIAIALAWPETYCKQAGAWYDKPANWLGIAKNNYYQVGHAAVVLVEPDTNECLYFDFGRYHAPFGRGRVRDKFTDHELKLKTKANIEGAKLLNLNEILQEIQSKEECHGDGKVEGSAAVIEFNKAYYQAKKLQGMGTLPYGPFTPNGTNCSRFVRTVLCCSLQSKKLRSRLSFTKTLSPTPIRIVQTLKQ